MTTLLAYVFGLLLVGGLLFLVASFAFGRDEEMVPALPEGTPLELPDDRPADGHDLRELRLSVVARGYRMDEVDWLLDRLAEQVDARDREIARLRSVLHVEPVDPEGGRPEPTRVAHRPGSGAAPDTDEASGWPRSAPDLSRPGAAAAEEASGWPGSARASSRAGAAAGDQTGWSGPSGAADRPGSAGGAQPAGGHADADGPAGER